MAYEKQDFTDGQVLTAQHLNHMEDAIAALEGSLEKLYPAFADSGAAVVCEPAEGQLLNVVSHITPGEDLTGCTRIALWRGGLNLWDEVWELGSITTGGIDQTSANTIRSANYIPVKGGVTLRLCFPQMCRMLIFGKNKEFLKISYPAADGALTPECDGYIRFAVGGAIGGLPAITQYGNDICICVDRGGAAAYEPYRGEMLHMELGQTVYGGSLDWGRGVLTVTHASDGTELTEPYTVRLTPQQIPALSGVNTLCSEPGNTQVSGKADLAAVIEKLRNAVIALGGNI